MAAATEINQAVRRIQAGDVAPVYLVAGERYLAKDAVDRLLGALLPSPDQGTLHAIDGEEEDTARVLSLLRTYSMFPGRRVVLVRDSRIFHSRKKTSDLWAKVAEAAAEKNGATIATRLSAFLQAAGLLPDDIAEEHLGKITAARWQELFGMARPDEDLSWTGPVLEQLVAKAAASRAKGGLNTVDAYVAAFEGTLPPGHVLVLTAETVDKRTRLFKAVKKHGVVVDVAVEAGSSKGARDAQHAALKELAQRVFASAGKKAASVVLEGLLARVGFHPAAVVSEAEKLALYTGDRDTVTRDDLDLLVSRTREEALFELSEQVAEKNLSASLASLARLRQDRIHDLAIVAALRNFLLKLLTCRALIERRDVGYRKGIQFPVFQKTCLATLQAEKKWNDIIGGHPFAAFKLFERAAGFELVGLRNMLALLLEAEFLLKSGPRDGGLVVEDFLLAVIPDTRREKK